MTKNQLEQLKEHGDTGPPEKHMRWIHVHRNDIVKPSKSKLEIWLDYHNHEMELVRTIVPFTVLILQVFILVNIL